MIKHIHLDNCDSTQTEILKYLDGNNQEFVLVSTDNQSKGVGRRGNQWVQFEDSLAFSLSLQPAKVLTLTPLEIGVLLIKILSEVTEEKLFLKWPNDILNEQKQKIAGLIINNISKDFLIVGIGINVGTLAKDYLFDHFEAGSIQTINKYSKKDLSYKITEYILKERLMRKDKIIQQWQSRCLHQNMLVKIYDDEKVFCEGYFLGIGDQGEALVQNSKSKKIEKVFSGSLSF